MSHETTILKTLIEVGQPMFIDDLHKRTGIEKNTMHRRLAKMHKNGLVLRELVTHYTYCHLSSKGKANRRQYRYTLL